MSDTFFAVFDANNFYVSCERVFRPKLLHKPTVVVSASGGIVLARSNEAKALGVPMAAPVFKMKEVFEKYAISSVPAHFSLYGEMSSRIATILHSYFPHIEEYSIDESFIYLPRVANIETIVKKCQEVREIILKWTGIPVSVGIAKTKTLAKVAVKFAKKGSSGIIAISTEEERIAYLSALEVQDVWGIGRSLGPKLLGYGIQRAIDLSQEDPVWGKKLASVGLAHTINELRGIPCISVTEQPAPQKTTMSTGTFEKEITDKEELRVKLGEFAQRATKHIRKHGEVAGGMGMFVRGNRFRSEERSLRLQAVEIFPVATAYSPRFMDAIDAHMNELFFEGVRVKRAGVFLFDLLPESERQLTFVDPNGEVFEKERAVMKAIDSLSLKRERNLFSIRI